MFRVETLFRLFPVVCLIVVVDLTDNVTIGKSKVRVGIVLDHAVIVVQAHNVYADHQNLPTLLPLASSGTILSTLLPLSGSGTTLSILLPLAIEHAVTLRCRVHFLMSL